MYPRAQLKKWYVYCGDKLVEVVNAITDRGAIEAASALTGRSAATLHAQTTVRGHRA
ncbi:TPA: hypothetical protein ACU967_002286 [Burkholderia contaminans]|uniref:hypothetical protein n=1 Tax=Burkholderia contaminans TaxID=488447 RepID=UPI00158E2EAC|nr:hypothetical protein [Burkholderia contaminans]HDR9065528.1 hypothetical protein [Burkholderia vietnamiensis]MBM6427967.1 hypothetical protein [Burkholderia contaminans]MCA7876797.1 hypothetical protein [Burkholderia contaminans]MDN8024179.1 hypothetical protein [Burkholderia contaminans]HDR9071275.1 hypothetical protein [Burkholderia vietnamiensis]